MEDYIRVIYIVLPTTIKAYTIPDSYGFYTIYLNAKLSYEQNERSYHHELRHIKNGDYDKGTNVGLIEIYVHQND